MGPALCGTGRNGRRPGVALTQPAARRLPQPTSGIQPDSRLMAFALRETKEVLRDPVRLGFAFIGSTILLFIFSYGITTDVDEIKFAVLDQDRSPQSRAYISEFSGSRYFREEAAASPARAELEARMEVERHLDRHRDTFRFRSRPDARQPAGSFRLD